MDVPSNAGYFPAYVGTSVFFTPSLEIHYFLTFSEAYIWFCGQVGSAGAGEFYGSSGGEELGRHSSCRAN